MVGGIKMKKVLAAILAALMVFSFAGCKKSTSSNAGSTEKTKVNFWYLWTGDEAKYIENIVTAYNKSQDKVQVVGLSTPDSQKIITAISGGNGPDITDSFGNSMYQYSNDGIALALDDLMSKNGVKADDFVKEAFEQQQVGGKTYALPISLNLFGLYYNEDLLNKDGLKVPTTMEDLWAESEKATKEEGGKITQLGSPFVPLSNWYECTAFAYGTDFGKADASTLTPDNEGFKETLKFEASQVSKFKGMNNFVSSGVAKQYTAQDPFCAGTQLFRIDGPWLYKTAKDAGVNVKIVGIPGSKAKGGTGYTLCDTSNFYITANSKHPDAAFDFLKYITDGAGAKMFVTQKGDLPALKSLTTDSEVTGLSDGMKGFLDILSQNHLTLMPSGATSTKYTEAIDTAVKDVIAGKSYDDAMKTLVDATKALG